MQYWGMTLSKTGLDNTFTDSALSIEGYSLVRRDLCRSGGGVAFYIRNVVDYKIKSDVSEADLEFLCIQIQNPRPIHFSFQTGTDLQINQLSYLISSRSSLEKLKRKILNQIYLVI